MPVPLRRLHRLGISAGRSHARSHTAGPPAVIASLARAVFIPLTVLVTVLALCAPAGSARAEEPAAPSGDSIPPLLRAAPSETEAGGEAGLRIYVNPLTGRFTSRPGPLQVLRLSQAIEESRPERRGDFRRFELPQGGTGIYVGDRFMTSTVAHTGPDGELHLHCSHGPDEPHSAEAQKTSQSAAPLK